MRLIARRTVVTFAQHHPVARAAAFRWANTIEAGRWETMASLAASFPSAVVLNGERARFEIAGGSFRLIASFDLRRQIAFVKFIGTHAEYDRVDALTVSQF
jgi:mRNA interferase HigB